MEMNSIDKILQSPDSLPVHLDCTREIVEFITLAPGQRRDALYLARDRVQGALDQFSLSDLLGRKTLFNKIPGPNYIFFLPFSGSTLLCRIFESVMGCHVIKEPEVFNELSFEFNKPSDGTGKRAHVLLDLLNTLFARTHDPNHRVLIKAPNPGCNLLEPLLNHPQTGQVFFISADLDFFLAQSLKHAVRIENIRQILRDFSYSDRLTDAEALAYYWVLNMKMLRQAKEKVRLKTIQVINCHDILERPLSVIKPMAAAMALGCNDKDLAEAVAKNWKLYSKDPRLSFPHEVMDLEHSRLALKFRAEIQTARQWVQNNFKGENLL